MRTALLLALALSALSACGTPPRVILPDGAHRSAINSPEAIAQYSAALQTQQPPSPPQAAQRIASLEQQVAALRLQWQQAAAPQPTEPPRGATPTPVAIDGATIIHNAHDIVFHIPAQSGHSDFTPGSRLTQLLLDAAGLSRKIDIRGHADSEHKAVAARRLIGQRRLHVRLFLVARGVAPNKLGAIDTPGPVGAAPAGDGVDIIMTGMAPTELEHFAHALREHQP